jgi:hypothetical protein
MKKLAAAFLALHGFAHLVGTATAWRLVEPDGGYPTALLGGRLEVGTTVLEIGGAFWLLGAVAFAVAAFAVAFRRPWAVEATAGAAVYSLALSALYWPEAVVGVVVNAAILVVLAATRVRRAGPRPVRAG